MRINKISIENFGNIEQFSAQFSGRLNVICSKYWTDILSILAIISGSCTLGFNSTRRVFTRSTRIYASISGTFGTAEVELFYDGGCEHCCASKVALNGRPSSFKELRAAIGVGEEEEECAVYINADDFRKFVPFAEYDFARKLNSYLNCVPQSGYQNVMGTPQFKELLHEFICSFGPVSINSSKDMWLSIAKDGVFIPVWHGEVRHDLSAAEREIFNFLCFVEVNRFWGYVADVRQSDERLPLFIGDFLCRIDRATDITPLISRANSLGRQTFLFCYDERSGRLGGRYLNFPIFGTYKVL